jgi:hypothetical protein
LSLEVAYADPAGDIRIRLKHEIATRYSRRSLAGVSRHAEGMQLTGADLPF